MTEHMDKRMDISSLLSNKGFESFQNLNEAMNKVTKLLTRNLKQDVIEPLSFRVLQLSVD